MRTLFKILPILAIVILAVGCQKEEDDTLIPNGAETRTITGRILDADGKPMEGVSIEMYCNIQKGSFMPAVTSRLKAQAKTDAQGIYRLSFYRQDDERKYTEDEGIFAYYTISTVGLSDTYFCGWIDTINNLDKFWEDEEVAQIDDYKLFKKRSIEVKISTAPAECKEGMLSVVFAEHAARQTGETFAFDKVPAQFAVNVPVNQTVKFILRWSEEKSDTTEVRITDTTPTSIEF